jgi:hypothetical protein
MTFPSLAEKGVQPPRDPSDDILRLHRIGEKLCIEVMNADGTTEKGHICISCRNAWTLVGLLSLFIGLKLPSSVAKRIHL